MNASLSILKTAVQHRAICFSQRLNGSVSAVATTTTSTTTRFGKLIVFGLVGEVVVSSSKELVSTTKCDDGKGGSGASSSIWNKIFPKDTKTDSIDWSKTIETITSGNGFDILGQAAGEPLQKAIDSGIPTQLSYGFISGYCSGLALKKVGKAAAVVFGLGFMSLQTLSYYGYVKIDQNQISKDVNNLLDINDDGKVDAKDGEIVMNKAMSILQYNMPSGSGFVAGFVGGLRSG